MKVELVVFGDKAKEIIEQVWGDKYYNVVSGDVTDKNVKAYFTYRSVEGHPKVTIELDI